jgi:hypothetical protein
MLEWQRVSLEQKLRNVQKWQAASAAQMSPEETTRPDHVEVRKLLVV